MASSFPEGAHGVCKNDAQSKTSENQTYFHIATTHNVLEGKGTKRVLNDNTYLLFQPVIYASP